MSKILDFALISHENGNVFAEETRKAIGIMQDKNLEVEVQYQPQLSEPRVMFSAIIIGREKEVIYFDAT